MATSPLGEKLLRQMTMGLQPGQTDIDLHDEVENVETLPREDGYLVNRKTGELVETADTYPFDDPYIASLTEYKTILGKDPDFHLVRVVGGLMGIDPFELVRGDSHARFKRVSQTIRDVLRDNMKKRSITVDQRNTLIKGLTTQQSDLEKVRERLQRIYETMAPTVKRWSFLASITGYTFEPEIAPDEDFRELALLNEPVPYCLLVRYVYPQYTSALESRNMGMHDTLYWEAYNSEFQWAANFLTLYRESIGSVMSFDAPTQRIANFVYLFLRDIALGSCLRLVPPLAKGDAGPRVTKNKKKKTNYDERPGHVHVDDFEWLLPLDSETSSIGRYHTLTRTLERTRAYIHDILKTDEIRLEAITRIEARNEGPSPFNFTPDAATQKILESPISENDPTLLRIIGALRLVRQIDLPANYAEEFNKKGLHAIYMQWLDGCDRFSDAIIGPRPVNFSLWIRLVRHVLAPRAERDHESHLALFLLQQMQRKMNATYDDIQGTNQQGCLIFSWDQNDVPVSNERPSLVSMNLLEHLLFQREPAEPANVVPRWNGRFVYTFLGMPANGEHLEINNLAVQPAAAAPPGVEMLTKVLIQVPLDDASRLAWKALEPLNERFVQEIAKVTPGLNVAKIREALHLYQSSLILWTRLWQNTSVAAGFISALYTDFIERRDPALVEDQANRLNNVSYSSEVKDTYVPLLKALNEYKDVGANFYHELFRSTFLSPYDRRNIDAAKLVQVTNGPDVAGDVLIGAELAREDSNNETTFENVTWEKLYANLFHAPINTSVYWRSNFVTLIKGAPLRGEDATHSILGNLWERILAGPRYWPPNPTLDKGVPDFGQFRLALGSATKPPSPLPPPPPSTEAISQQSLYQALAFSLQTKWNSNIMPNRLYQSSVLDEGDASESVPPITILRHMIVFTLAYFPRVRELLVTHQREIDKSVASARDSVRSVAANDHNYAVSQVNDLIRNLYVPEREWHLQGLLTGHLDISPMITSALGLAYNALQELAHRYKTSDNAWNSNGKRWRPTSIELDYSHLKNVPMDVISAYDGEVVTRDRIVTTTKEEKSVVEQLRIAIGELIKQYICHMRLDVPEQYKTVIQYQRSPVGVANAKRALLRFRFRDMGNQKWQVFLV